MILYFSPEAETLPIKLRYCTMFFANEVRKRSLSVPRFSNGFYRLNMELGHAFDLQLTCIISNTQRYYLFEVK